jgi:hypothetical protein
MIDFLKQKGIQKERIAALVGHKDESITTGLYGNPYEPVALAPVIEEIDFELDVVPFHK